MFAILPCLFIAALCSPAGKGLTSWLLFVMSNRDYVSFPLGIVNQVCFSYFNTFTAKRDCIIVSKMHSNKAILFFLKTGKA